MLLCYVRNLLGTDGVAFLWPKDLNGSPMAARVEATFQPGPQSLVGGELWDEGQCTGLFRGCFYEVRENLIKNVDSNQHKEAGTGPLSDFPMSL